MVIKEDFSRRKFIRYSVIGGAVVPLLSGIPYENEVYGGVFNAPKDLENLTEMERIHLPKVLFRQLLKTEHRHLLLLAWIIQWKKITI